MNRVLFLPLFLLLFSCSDDISQKAGVYNDHLVRLADNCLHRRDELLTTIHARDAQKSQAALDELKRYASLALDSMKQLESPGDTEEDKAFREAAIAYVDNLRTLSEKEYVEYRNLFMLPDSVFSAGNAQRHDALADAINARDSAADDAFIQAQARFARRYKVRIE